MAISDMLYISKAYITSGSKEDTMLHDFEKAMKETLAYFGVMEGEK